jgi:hypothetical protein
MRPFTPKWLKRGSARNVGEHASQPRGRHADVSPELDACRSTGLIALKEHNPSIKDVSFDVDVTIAKANTKVEDTLIKTIVIGDAYLEKGKKDIRKPSRLDCLPTTLSHTRIVCFAFGDSRTSEAYGCVLCRHGSRCNGLDPSRRGRNSKACAGRASFQC